MFLNDKPCVGRLTINDQNHVELNYYLFIISSDKCPGRCNVLSPKICVLRETKEINVKAFNMVTDKSDAKTMAKDILHFM